MSQAVRPLNMSDVENMVEAGLRGEIDIYFPSAFNQKSFVSFKSTAQRDISEGLGINPWSVAVLKDDDPYCIIDTTKDAETLFALRFGPFERITDI